MQSSGNIRAAILGFNDGLISNFCLIMGFAGGTVIAGNPEYILLAGFAGLIAGSLSMGAGEYVSMKAQVDLYRYQIQKEQEEILLWPEEEEEELKLIYMVKGLSEDIAIKTAQKIMSDPKSAIDTMAREELGLNPDDLGSPVKASLTSILAFASGAIVPIIPFIFTLGNTAVFISAILSTFVIMIIGGMLIYQAIAVVVLAIAFVVFAFNIGKFHPADKIRSGHFGRQDLAFAFAPFSALTTLRAELANALQQNVASTEI